MTCCCSLAGTPACKACMQRNYFGYYQVIPNVAYPIMPTPFPDIKEPLPFISGWICPKCGRVNSPDTKTCDCK